MFASGSKLLKCILGLGRFGENDVHVVSPALKAIHRERERDAPGEKVQRGERLAH